MNPSSTYIGRIAPSPTGFLHLGHAATFYTAHERARAQNGKLLLRIEDLDQHRCKEHYTKAIMEDLLWLGLTWEPNPLYQSARNTFYLSAWNKLKDSGCIYPSFASRSEILSHTAENHPHQEPLFPKALRSPHGSEQGYTEPGEMVWRFRVPDGRAVAFEDCHCGSQVFETGKDFGDFIVWRREGWAAYELAVVVDDHCSGVTEVVRGQDLLLSTARQILIYEALGWEIPAFYHCPLIKDESGQRLAKSFDSLSLRELRSQGHSPENILASAKKNIEIHNSYVY